MRKGKRMRELENNSNKVIALMIDAENISPKYIEIILDEVSLSGTPAYKRIYGDWTSPDMAGWKKVLLENSLTPIQQFSYTQGKNASDSAMIIDAMDVLYTKNVDGFCLVSSDSDFTRLASRLRESRMFVIGMGESKTPTAFKAACDTFKYLDVLKGLRDNAQEVSAPVGRNAKRSAKAVRREKAKRSTPVEPHFDAELAALPCEPHFDEELSAFVPLEVIIDKIQELIDYDSDEDGYVSLSQIGDLLSRLYTDFDTRNYGFSKLHKLVDSTGLFETKCELLPGGGKKLVVRNL